jgi:hypothetical protein
MRYIFFVAIIFFVASCTKVQRGTVMPQIQDLGITQLTASQIAWLQQVAAQKRDSMRIADSLANLTGVVDTNSLFYKKNKMIAIVEANDHYFPNVLYYQDSVTHKPVFDVAFPFSANMNINSGTGKAYVFYNPEQTAMIQNGVMRYVQNQGMKVGLSILGNHDAAGWSNFTSIDDAKAFAQIVAYEVRTKNYAAVLSDDEYSNSVSGALSNSYVVAMAEIKNLLPDIYLCYYGYGGGSGSYNGKKMGEYADAMFSAYYPSDYTSTYVSSYGFTTGQCFPACSETGNFSNPLAEAQQVKANGQGGVMFYNVCGLTTSPNVYSPYAKGLKNITLYVPAGKLVAAQQDGINNTLQ